MKKLLVIILLLAILQGCKKSDVHFIRGKLITCDISQQSDARVGYLIGVGFKKTYSDDGLVKTVTTKMNSAFFDFDSVVYSFSYSHGKANVMANKYFLVPVLDSEGRFVVDDEARLVLMPHPDRQPEQYEFAVEFDRRTLNAVKAGTTVFHYDKFGKLTGYDGFTLVYDNKGNITTVNTDNGGSVVFEYDYTKRAKQQIYYTTGFMTNEMYNLMEIMNWIPVEPKNLRTSHTLFVEAELFFGEFFFYDHVINKDGLLTSFKESFNPEVPAEGLPPIAITYNCVPIRKTIKHFTSTLRTSLFSYSF